MHCLILILEKSMANSKEGSSKIRRHLKDCKYPKIPVDQVYKKKVLGISSSYAVKDFEDTITVNSNDKDASVNLLSSSFLQGFIKKQHMFVHLGLVQVAVKPLMRDGLGAPIVVTIRDARHVNFHDSLLALVKANLTQGPFYFECFPGFSVSLEDNSLFEVLTLDVETGGVPLALTYRVVCKAMSDLSPQALKEPVLGETTYFQPATGTCGTTKWDESELQTYESSTSEQQELKSDDPVLQKVSSIATKLANEEGSSRNRKSLDDWKYTKIPVNQVYNRSEHIMISPPELFQVPSLWSKARKILLKSSQTIKEYEKTITLNANKQMNNVSIALLEGLTKKKKGFVHLGLFQIAIKPLLNDGLETAPIIACVRDTRLLHFEKSLFALVQANLCDGPFYFNCCPGFSIPLEHDSNFIKLYVKSCVPLELAFRLVCNVTTDITLDYRHPIRGETICYHSITETFCTTKWDEVQVPEAWT